MARAKIGLEQLRGIVVELARLEQRRTAGLLRDAGEIRRFERLQRDFSAAVAQLRRSGAEAPRGEDRGTSGDVRLQPRGYSVGTPTVLTPIVSLPRHSEVLPGADRGGGDEDRLGAADRPGAPPGLIAPALVESSTMVSASETLSAPLTMPQGIASKAVSLEKPHTVETRDAILQRPTESERVESRDDSLVGKTVESKFADAISGEWNGLLGEGVAEGRGQPPSDEFSVRAAIDFVRRMCDCFVGSEEESRERSLAVLVVSQDALGSLSHSRGNPRLVRRVSETAPLAESRLTMESSATAVFEPPLESRVLFAYYHDSTYNKPKSEALTKRLRAATRRLSALAPGGYGLPVAVLEQDPAPARALPVRYSYLGTWQLSRPQSSGVDAVSADAVYRETTRPGSYPDSVRYLAWFKQGGSLRLYIRGEPAFQLMRGRDGGGWILRIRGRLLDALEKVWESTLASKAQSQLARREILTILYDVCVLLSESRSGAAVYIVPDRDLFAEWVRAGHEYDAFERGASTSPPSRNVAAVRHRSLVNVWLGGPTNVASLNELLHYLREDGAVVVSADGEVCAFGTYFVGFGGRRGIAQDVVRKERRCMVLVVSQDGGMELHWAVAQSDQGDLRARRSELGERLSYSELMSQ